MKVTSLVQRYVNEVLNNQEVGLLDDLFSPAYCDHDPILGGRRGGIGELRVLVRFLALPKTDLHFTLEDLFGESSKCGYRLFGEGFGNWADFAALMSQTQVVGPGVVAPPEYGPGQDDSAGDRRQLVYSCTGIFCGRDRLLERWGRPLVG
jgi:hypothetical protein